MRTATSDESTMGTIISPNIDTLFPPKRTTITPSAAQLARAKCRLERVQGGVEKPMVPGSSLPARRCFAALDVTDVRKDQASPSWMEAALKA